MIFNLLTTNQWIVIYIIIAVAMMIGVAILRHKSDELHDEIPPFIGAVLLGVLMGGIVFAFLGLIHGLTYLWMLP